MENKNLVLFKELFLGLKEKFSQEKILLEDCRHGADFDQALGTSSRQLILKMMARKNIYMKKINNALKKLDNGSFGECEECGQQIHHNRLIARPTADLCISCKEHEEHEEQHIVYIKKSMTSGQELVTVQM